jgi:hypothetical protein
VLNGATQAAVATFHRTLDQFVEKQRGVQVLNDRRLTAIETTQASILEALNALPNQIAAVFSAQYAENPRPRNNPTPETPQNTATPGGGAPRPQSPPPDGDQVNG